MHKHSTYVTYRWFKEGNWTGTLAGYWVANVQLIIPQTQSQPPSQTTTEAAPEQTFDTGTITLLVVLVGMGLLLGCRHIKRLIGESRKKPSEQSTPAKPTGHKRLAGEKEWEEL